MVTCSISSFDTCCQVQTSRLDRVRRHQRDGCVFVDAHLAVWSDVGMAQELHELSLSTKIDDTIMGGGNVTRLNKDQHSSRIFTNSLPQFFPISQQTSLFSCMFPKWYLLVQIQTLVAPEAGTSGH